MKTLRKFFTLLAFCCINLAASAQDAGPSPYIIAMEMSVATVYEMTPTIGFANQPAQHYKQYKQLLRIAKPGELIEIIHAHANPVVRLYAYQALLAQKVPVPTTLVQKMKSDRTKVVAQQGCVAFDSTVGALAEKKLETANAASYVSTPTFF